MPIHVINLGMTPKRQILTVEDLKLFNQSETFAALVAYITRLSVTVRGLELSTPLDTPPIGQGIVEHLKRLTELIKETPPLETSSRFGNPAFRQFLDKLDLCTEKWLEVMLPPKAYEEPLTYFIKGFGDRRRVDYGTGWSLEKLGILTPAEDKFVVLRIFPQYLGLMRQLQLTYWLEPAGSQGVWGLDDYHFLPFLFGAAQLVGHPYIRPKSIHDSDVLDGYAAEYLYLEAISFIKKVKSGGLRWHSPMLDDISSAKSWEKIADGFIKMYQDHVLLKLPIMQHFLFGELIPFTGASGDQAWRAAEQAGLDCVHAFGQQVPNCCGIRLPSAIAAAAAASGATVGLKNEALPRLLPFD